MLKPICPPISLTDALSGKRIRVSSFDRGSALCALTNNHPVQLAAPQPILGYWQHEGGLVVYVPGQMPAHLRTAAEEERTQEEVLLEVPLPAGIREIDLSDCRREYRVQLTLAA